MIKIIRKIEQKCLNFTLQKYSFSKKEKKKMTLSLRLG